jgi:hypothetical protein
MTQRARGRIPNGAELDRVAGTSNYGRRVLRRWRDAGHIPPAVADQNRHPDRARDRQAELAAA